MWIGNIKLPKSGYLSKSIRGLPFLELTQDNLEYLGWTCKSCPTLLKKQARFLYYVNLYPQLSELELDEEEFNEVLWEDFPKQKEYK